MKFLILGSYSTGKTTIINEILKNNPNLDYYILPDLARTQIEEDKIDINNLSIEETINFQIRLARRTQKIKEDMKKKEHYIVDGGDLLLLFYFFDLNPDLKKHKHFLNEVYKEVYDTNYDYILYTPIEFGIDNDGLRHNDEIKRYRIDKRIRNYLEFSPIPYIELRGSIEDRINIINNLKPYEN